MDDLEGAQPVCPSCGTVMRDYPKGFHCVTCVLNIDTSEVTESVIMPPAFNGLTVHGG